MIAVRNEVADLICNGGALLDPKRWLAEEACDLATQIPYLDEIPPQAILPLAALVTKGVSDAKELALALDIEQTAIDVYLDALCEFQFAEWTGIGYQATPAGVHAFEVIGERIVARELFELKRRLEYLKLINRTC